MGFFSFFQPFIYTETKDNTNGFYSFFQKILPKNFLNDTLINTVGIYKAIGRQFDDLKASILDTQDQFFVSTATWSLDQYEAEYGIKLVDGGTNAERQNNIMAKMRGGIGCNPTTIQNVLSSYGYNTQIIEDYANYQFTIKFIDFKGIPSNMGDLKLLLQPMIPAHLNVIYQYLYNTYGTFNGNYTYDQLENSGLSYQDLQTKLPS